MSKQPTPLCEKQRERAPQVTQYVINTVMVVVLMVVVAVVMVMVAVAFAGNFLPLLLWWDVKLKPPFAESAKFLGRYAPLIWGT